MLQRPLHSLYAASASQPLLGATAVGTDGISVPLKSRAAAIQGCPPRAGEENMATIAMAQLELAKTEVAMGEHPLAAAGKSTLTITRWTGSACP